jgi:RHH-type proline utilization regulon transcriptional repressor/proline dehydrogenase/delta 1-pyrroline-5-carboxylate dehydrogenase
LSGTGPKAGGHAYVARLGAPRPAPEVVDPPRSAPDHRDLPARLRAAAAIDPARGTASDLPGPTGESNRIAHLPRGPVLCLGPGEDAARAQAAAVEVLGGRAVAAPGLADAERLRDLPDLSAVLWWGDTTTARALARALAARPGAIVPLVTSMPDAAHVLLERHVCVDTTASGGNAALLAAVGG